jgi:hypothetical protein
VLHLGGAIFRKLRLTALALAVLAPNPDLVRAQSASVSGRVVDAVTRVGIEGVTVRVQTMDVAVRTNGVGAFSIPGLRPGVRVLVFEAIGYSSRSDSVRLDADGDVSVVVTLSPDPLPLDPLAVEARVGARTAWLGSRGFFQRGETNTSLLHITQEELVHRNVRNLRDVLRRTEGVRIRRLVDGGSELLLEPSPLPDGAQCAVSVFVNGSEVEFGTFTWTGADWNDRAQRPLRFDDLMILEDIDGIELYGPDEMPVASDSCGALFLWSSRIRSQVDEPFTGTIRGTAVHDASGRRISGVRITLMPSGIRAITDQDGNFVLPDLVPGDYAVVAEVPGAQSWTGTVRVSAYGVVTVELRM